MHVVDEARGCSSCAQCPPGPISMRLPLRRETAASVFGTRRSCVAKDRPASGPRAAMRPRRRRAPVEFARAPRAPRARSREAASAPSTHRRRDRSRSPGRAYARRRRIEPIIQRGTSRAPSASTIAARRVSQHGDVRDVHQAGRVDQRERATRARAAPARSAGRGRRPSIGPTSATRVEPSSSSSCIDVGADKPLENTNHRPAACRTARSRGGRPRSLGCRARGNRSNA